MRSKATTYWLMSFLLLLPVTTLYVSHFLPAAGQVATGFIQYDQPYYMANAREFFDSGKFALTYANPFDQSYAAPRIYFQPHLFLLGLWMRVTGMDPGIVYVLFGFFAALACARLGIALFETYVRSRSRYRALALVLFFWGGGLLTLTALLKHDVDILLKGSSTEAASIYLFRFDPSFGWWFFNFGRNLVFPVEAFYHALFFACVLAILRGRFALSLLLVRQHVPPWSPVM